jgi:hypothetical protein
VEYRGLSLDAKEVLKDTIRACLCIASRGQIYGDDYSYYKVGISKIRSHIIGGKFGGEIAGGYAGRILYLASAMLVGCNSISKIDATTTSSSNLIQAIKFPKAKSFSYLHIVDPVAYVYVVKASELLQGLV